MADYSVEVIEEPDLDSPAFALFRAKTGRQFVVGEGVLLVRKNGEPFFFFCVQEHSNVKPLFNEKVIHISSAVSVSPCDDADAEFISGLLESIQSLQNGQRYSIVFTTDRKGWLKQAKRYGYSYIGTHSITGQYCYERR